MGSIKQVLSKRMNKRKEGLNDIKQGIGELVKNSGTTERKGIVTTKNVGIEQKTTKTGNEKYGTLKGAVKVAKGIVKTLFNHPEWYENYDLTGIVNLNFGRRKGINSYAYSTSYAEPQVSACSLHINMVKPIGDTSAWDQAIQYLYTTIRSANSGSVNYNQADLERYVISVRSAHACYSVLRRAYATLKSIDRFDGRTPMAYFEAMGLDYKTFSENAANLKQFGDLMAIQIHKLMPLNIDLINRTRWLFSNAFLDSDDVKATPYFTVLRSSAYYSVTNSAYTTFGLHSPSSGTATGLDYATVIANISLLLQEFTINDTFSIIAGDILRAFGEAALYPAEIWDDNMEVPFIYDEAALTQIQNATIGIVDTNTFSITQATPQSLAVQSAVMYHNLGTFNQASGLLHPYAKKLVNTYKNAMTPGETISATRFVFIGDFTFASNTITVTVTSCGTEVISGISFVYYDAGSTDLYQLNTLSLSGCEVTTFALNTTDVEFTPSLWSQVDWCPAICFHMQNSGNTLISNQAMFDINNFALIDSQDQLAQFHAYASLSLLAVPNVAKLNNVTLMA